MNFTLKDDLIYCKNRLRVPDDATLITSIMDEYHNSMFGGRSVVERTFHRIHHIFIHMERYEADNKEICGMLFDLSKNQGTDFESSGVVTAITNSRSGLARYQYGLITGLPKLKGQTIIMVVVDRLSKYCHLMTLPTEYSAYMVAKAFTENVVKLHGIPQSIVSDRDKVFT